MIIKRMTASFGKLQGDTLIPGPGLNVIYAPNEGGKSTWSAFLRVMFYGMDSRERDTKTALADKNRYLPWSGGPMEGEIELEKGGRRLILRRFAKGNLPMGGFAAVYADTGREVEGLTAQNAGEVLLGVSRGVYERSAFVGQGAIPFTGEAELEKRLAALVSSGEETVSYSEADARLRQWLRRRKYNKLGLIPRLEEERLQLEGALSRVRSSAQRRTQVQRELTRLEEMRRELAAEQQVHRQLKQQEQNLKCAQAAENLKLAQAQEKAALARLEALESRREEHPLFSDLSPEEAWKQAGGDRAKAQELLTTAAARRPLPWVALAAGLALLMAGIAAWWLGQAAGLAPAAAGLVLGAAGLLFRRRGRKQAREADAQSRALLARYGARTPDDILEAAEAYRRQVLTAQEAVQQARLEAEKAADRRKNAQDLFDALLAGGARPEAEAQPITPPRRRPEETESLLASITGELSRLERELAALQGELSVQEDLASLEARRTAVEEELERRTAEYDALQLALTELAAAHAQLQDRFSPALNALAGKMMEQLTGGKYRQVTLNREFLVSAAEEGSVVPRRSLTLSQGTVDQLYLAVRLAVCELVLPEDGPPLVLDDALAAFDQERMERALDLLRQMGSRRQIFLFTCHRREEEYLAGAPDVTFLSLHSGAGRDIITK